MLKEALYHEKVSISKRNGLVKGGIICGKNI
jgi:hypothetical protein